MTTTTMAQKFVPLFGRFQNLKTKFVDSYSPIIRRQSSPKEAAVLTPAEEGEVKALFERWMVKYEKSYATAAEKEKRFEIFKQNALQEPGGLSKFADWTREEFTYMANGCRHRFFSDMQTTITEFLYGSVDHNPNAKKYHR